jgi:acetyl esterase
MPLDPDIAAWLAGLPKDVPDDLAGIRAQWSSINARSRALLRPELVPVEVGDVAVDGLRLRIFRPPGAARATVVFCHGGGWLIGDVETHRGHAGRLCVEAEAVVVSVDYRRAPEHRFPAAFEDALSATQWAAGEFGGDLVVAGDSAGGQLAASVALAARDLGLPLAAQLLIYPVADVRGGYRSAAGYPSRLPGDRGVGLALEETVAFADLYVDPDERDDWRVSPLAGDLRGVAPAVVHTAGLDVLNSEGRAYAEALRAAGVRVIDRDWPSLNHSYFGLGGVSVAADVAATQAALDLRQILLP